MKRSEFEQVVKAFSVWKIDKRKGNYRLPSGNLLSNYLQDLIQELCKNNQIAFAKNGNLYQKIVFDEKDVIFIPFADFEKLDNAEQEARAKSFVFELLN